MSRTRAKHFLHLIWVAALVAVYIYLQLHHQLPNQNGAVTPSSNSPGTPIVTPAAQATAGQSAALGKATKTTGCQVNAALPDPACTPGSIFAGATRDQICQSGYARSVRNVPESEKQQVYAMYGIAHHTPGAYEVDHLVSLELGGSNDIANLWPEAASPKPGFHEKDVVENSLHDQVCRGAVSLQDAQRQIATNWLALYSQTK